MFSLGFKSNLYHFKPIQIYIDTISLSFLTYLNIHHHSTFQTYNIRNEYKSNKMKMVGIFQN